MAKSTLLFNRQFFLWGGGEIHVFTRGIGAKVNATATVSLWTLIADSILTVDNSYITRAAEMRMDKSNRHFGFFFHFRTIQQQKNNTFPCILPNSPYILPFFYFFYRVLLKFFRRHSFLIECINDSRCPFLILLSYMRESNCSIFLERGVKEIIRTTHAGTLATIATYWFASLSVLTIQILAAISLISPTFWSYMEHLSRTTLFHFFYIPFPKAK